MRAGACYLSFCLLIVSLTGFAQTKSDTLFVAKAQQATIAVYERALLHDSKLFNGSEYKEYQSPTDEHPYLFEDWRIGSVVYHGELFEQVPLLFDLSTGSLVTETSGQATIKLVSEHVSNFRIDQRLFEAIRNAPIANGFYEVVHDSVTKVLVGRTRSLQQKNTVSGIERRFDERVQIYLVRSGQYWSVKTKKSVLQVLQDKKSLLKKVRLTKPFGTYRLENIRSLAEAYDRLQP